MGGTCYSDIADKRSCVYWLYDADDTLLYVGLTTNPEGRLSKHRSRQPWGKRIASMELTWYPNREAAKYAERCAIHDDAPIFNVSRPQVEVI